MATATYDGVQWTDADVVNPDDYFANVGCRNYRPYLMHDHGFVVAVVFASSLQDALDEAADAGKLDRYQITEADQADYPDDDGVTFLGNASVAYDIESLGCIELPNPPFSFVALFTAAYSKGAV